MLPQLHLVCEMLPPEVTSLVAAAPAFLLDSQPLLLGRVPLILFSIRIRYNEELVLLRIGSMDLHR